MIVLEVTRRTAATDTARLAGIAAAVRREIAAAHGVAVAEVVLIRAETLPRTSSGKVRRRACRDAWRSGALQVVGRSALETVTADGDDAGTADLDLAALRALGPDDRRVALRAAVRWHAAQALRAAPAAVADELPLTALGLDSLAASELSASLEAALGMAPPLSDLLEGITVAELADRLSDRLGATLDGETPFAPAAGGSDSGDRDGDSGEVPLTPGQRALWFLHQLAPESTAYHLVIVARLAGDTDAVALHRACQALLDRHEALRAGFSAGPDGPVQRLRQGEVVAFEPVDAAAWSEEETARQIAAAAWRPFDLERGPLLRAHLFARPGGPLLVLAVHHIAADFASLAVLARELGTLYSHAASHTAGAPPATVLPPLPGSFGDFARWQGEILAGRQGEELRSFWLRRLAGLPALALPTDRRRPATQTFRGGARGLWLDAERLAALRALAARPGATLFTVLLAGFQALLGRISGQEDFAVGAPASSRPDGHWGERLGGVVGYFANPLPLRADLSGDPGPAAHLERVRRGVLEALAHRQLPLPWMVESLPIDRDPARPPLFQVMLTLQQAPSPELQPLAAFAVGRGGVRCDLGDLRLESVALEPAGAPLEWTVMAAEIDGGLALSLQFNADLFDAATAERTLGHLAVLLDGLAAAPDGRRLSALPLLTAAETRQLAAWNRTAASYDLRRPLHAWVLAQAARTPDAAAVTGEAGAVLSYGELAARAGRLACHLRRLGAGPETRVGIAAERSPELLVGLLATLMAGAAYVPFDPSYPLERLAWMLDDSGVQVLLTQRRLVKLLPPGAATVICLDEEGGEDAPRPELSWVDPDSPAYMIYTSGSTGRPKGAINTHRAIVNRLLWMQEAFGLEPGDRVLHKTPTGFDVSVWELFWPLMVGAPLVLARPGGHQDPSYLAHHIASQGVTTAHFVPSMLQVFLAEPAAGSCTGLRRVIASGEALTPELARRFQERLGVAGVELHNLYGPTEAAVDVTWWPLPRAGDEDENEEERPVPIGRPVSNTRIHLLDRLGRLGRLERGFQGAPVGVPGEIGIAGVQLARGYHRRPDLTAERFVPDPAATEPGARLYRTGDLGRRRPDGAVEFLGRLDHQIKVRGVRIEPGEIEAALTALPGVREAVVAARGEGPATRLVAWVVPADATADESAGTAALTVTGLREALRRRLPEVMVPSSFVLLDALPLSPNGKLLRNALPDPEAGQRPLAALAPLAPMAPMAPTAPRTSAEETLVRIWSDLLPSREIGVHDHFFDLGGHSLLATQMLSRVRNAFGVDVPLAVLFDDIPTIENLARAVRRYQAEQADEEELAAALAELDGMSDDEVRALLASEEL